MYECGSAPRGLKPTNHKVINDLLQRQRTLQLKTIPQGPLRLVVLQARQG
jgi:hypothetical protein